jgi:hypothetical protein
MKQQFLVDYICTNDFFSSLVNRYYGYTIDSLINIGGQWKNINIQISICCLCWMHIYKICMSVLNTYLQDLEELLVRYKPMLVGYDEC